MKNSIFIDGWIDSWVAIAQHSGPKHDFQGHLVTILVKIMLGKWLRARWKRITMLLPVIAKIFNFFLFFGGLGPNYHIWAFGAKNTFSGISYRKIIT